MFINKTTMQLIIQAIKREGGIDLPAEGKSMFPLIKEGDLCRFVLCDPHSLKGGDIALFYTRMGNLVAHRYYYKQLSSERVVFLFKGDTNLGFDRPVREEQIVGKLIMIRRGHKEISVERPISHLWSKLIMALPVLSGLIQRYLHRKSQMKSGVSP